MTYLFKTLIIAAIGATTLTAQVSTVYAKGSDRGPDDTNTIVRTASDKPVAAQKNTVCTFSNTASHTTFIGNKFFLEQR